jgi:hypothetical protein
MFSRPGSEADFSFTKAKEESEAEESEADEDDVEVEANTETSNAEIKAQGNDILDDISIDTEEEDVEESKVETRGRKPINGFTDVINKMVKSERLFAFDDDKPLDEYTAKDIEELLEANLEERANQVRRETIKSSGTICCKWWYRS